MRSILFFFLVFGSLVQTTINNINFSMVDVLIPILLIYLWVKNRKIYIPLFGVFLFFLIIQFISVLLSDIAINSYNFREIIKTIIWYVYLMVGYNFVIADGVSYQDMLKNIKNSAYLFFGISYTFYLLYLNTGLQNFAVNYPPRFNGLLGDPNLFSGLCIFYIFYSFFQGKAALFIMSSVGLLLSASRTGVVSFFIVLAIFLFFIWCNKKQIKLSEIIHMRTFGAPITIFFSSSAFILIKIREPLALIQQAALRISGQDKFFNHSVIDRLSKWDMALSIFYSYPLFGIGRGNYFVYSQMETGSIFRAHNSYLHAMAETGIAGMLVFILLLFIPMVSLFKVEEWKMRIPFFGILAFLIVGLGINFENFRFYWVICGVLYGLKGYTSQSLSIVTDTRDGIINK